MSQVVESLVNMQPNWAELILKNQFIILDFNPDRELSNHCLTEIDGQLVLNETELPRRCYGKIDDTLFSFLKHSNKPRGRMTLVGIVSRLSCKFVDYKLVFVPTEDHVHFAKKLFSKNKKIIVPVYAFLNESQDFSFTNSFENVRFISKCVEKTKKELSKFLTKKSFSEIYCDSESEDSEIDESDIEDHEYDCECNVHKTIKRFLAKESEIFDHEEDCEGNCNDAMQIVGNEPIPSADSDSDSLIL